MKMSKTKLIMFKKRCRNGQLWKHPLLGAGNYAVRWKCALKPTPCEFITISFLAFIFHLTHTKKKYIKLSSRNSNLFSKPIGSVRNPSQPLQTEPSWLRCQNVQHIQFGNKRYSLSPLSRQLCLARKLWYDAGAALDFLTRPNVWMRMLCCFPVGETDRHTSQIAGGLWCCVAQWRHRGDDPAEKALWAAVLAQICLKWLETDKPPVSCVSVCITHTHTVEQKEQVAYTCRAERRVRLMWGASGERTRRVWFRSRTHNWSELCARRGRTWETALGTGQTRMKSGEPVMPASPLRCHCPGTLLSPKNWLAESQHHRMMVKECQSCFNEDRQTALIPTYRISSLYTVRPNPSKRTTTPGFVQLLHFDSVRYKTSLCDKDSVVGRYRVGLTQEIWQEIIFTPCSRSDSAPPLCELDWKNGANNSR